MGFMGNNPIDNQLTKYLHFLPFIEKNINIKPSEKGAQLIDDLKTYDIIISHHIKIDSYLDAKQSKPIVKNLLIKILNQDIQKELIDEKITDIDSLKALTKQYESWSKIWRAQADSIKDELTANDLNLIKSEIKRIYKKL